MVHENNSRMGAMKNYGKDREGGGGLIGLK